MPPEPALDRRQRRHARTRAALIDAAWELAHEVGLAGLTQRALAERVDLAQPSLYTYFASKNDLYDALFADGNLALIECMESLHLPDDPRLAFRVATHALVDFFVEDPVRYQLLYQRTIPGFAPSPDSYALAVRFYEWFRVILERAGVQAQGQIDVFVALAAGLTEAQLANEPGGDRWLRHLDWVLDMFLAAIARQHD